LLALTQVDPRDCRRHEDGNPAHLLILSRQSLCCRDRMYIAGRPASVRFTHNTRPWTRTRLTAPPARGSVLTGQEFNASWKSRTWDQPGWCSTSARKIFLILADAPAQQYVLRRQMGRPGRGLVVAAISINP